MGIANQRHNVLMTVRASSVHGMSSKKKAYAQETGLGQGCYRPAGVRCCTDDSSSMILQKHLVGWKIPIKALTPFESNGNGSLAVSGSLRKLLHDFRASGTAPRVFNDLINRMQCRGNGSPTMSG